VRHFMLDNPTGPTASTAGCSPHTNTSTEPRLAGIGHTDTRAARRATARHPTAGRAGSCGLARLPA
jgi:hypothetical protein